MSLKNNKMGEKLGPLSKEDLLFVVPQQYKVAAAEDLFWHISEGLENDPDYDIEMDVITVVYGRYAYRFRFAEGEINCFNHEVCRDNHEEYSESITSFSGDTKIDKHPTFGVEIPQIIKERVAC